MLPLRWFLVSLAVGVAVTAPIVWATSSGPVETMPDAVPTVALPEPFLGAWQPAGTGTDGIGRPMNSGYIWLPKAELEDTSVEVALRWMRKNLKGSFHHTKDGGLFMSAVDLAADKQESFNLQPGQGGLSVWVTVAGLSTAPKQPVRGPAVGGSGEAMERTDSVGFALAAERGAAGLRDEGWTMTPLDETAEEGMRERGVLLRYWSRGDQTLQELIQRTDDGSRRHVTRLPRQMDEL